MFFGPGAEGGGEGVVGGGWFLEGEVVAVACVGLLGVGGGEVGVGGEEGGVE